MKLTHKLCGAALLSVVGVSLALPNVTKADNVPVASKGEIEFTKNTTEDTSMPDITDTDSWITDLPVTDPGEFGIMAVTPLDFDKHAATFNGEIRNYNVLPLVANAGNSNEFKTENFVAFKDTRSTLNQKHTLSAELTKQFTASVDGGVDNVSLDGATITYKNIHLTQTIGDSSQYPVNTVLGNGSATETLAFGASKTFYQNLDADKGKGRFELVFGSKGENNIEESIQLDIPQSVNLFNAKYTATITWTLAETA